MSEAFEALSRKAATGELSPAERETLQRYLSEHPQRRADLDWDQAFSAQLEAKIADLPALPGWERTQRLLAQESQAQVQSQEQIQSQAQTQNQVYEQIPTPARNQPSASRPLSGRAPGVLDRCSDWLASVLGFGLNTQALAFGLIVAQVGVIGLLLGQRPEAGYSETRAAVADATPRGPLLRVSFRQDLREAELRRALAEIGGEIVGGPGQIGIYLIRVRGNDLQAAAQRLRQSGTTELVELVAPGK